MFAIINTYRWKQMVKKYLLARLTLVICVLTILTPSAASALTQEQKQLYDSGIHYYDAASSIEGAEGCTGSAPNGGSLDQFLRALITKEGTGGDPAKHTTGSSAYGKYQYFESTWLDQAKAYYPIAAAQYPDITKNVPEAIQDAVAYLEFSAKSVEEGGSVFRMALVHYQPAALTSVSVLNTVPQGNTLTPREYANEVVSDFNGNSGSDIPLLYNQAPDFATYEAKAGNPAALWAQPLNSNSELPPSTPPAGTTTSASTSPTLSTCSLGGIPAGSFVFYNQDNYPNVPYGDSTVAYIGCGPTAVAMVVATLADSSVTPVQTAAWGDANGGYTPGVGSNSNMLVGGPEHWGLKVQSIGQDFNAAIATLKAGGLVIAGGTSPGGINIPPLSKDGHVIVLRGLAANGDFLIANPAPGLQDGQNEGFSDSQLVGAGLKYMYAVTK